MVMKLRRTPPLMIIVAKYVTIAITTTIINGYLNFHTDTSCAVAFVASPRFYRRQNIHYLSMIDEHSSSGDQNESSAEDDSIDDDDESGENVIIDDLSWRVAKARFEETVKPQFLKRKPLKLPYAISQKWIQHNWAPKSQLEFEELVRNGDIKNVYISKRPEEYYGARGQWISWDHYLHGECSEEEEEVLGTNSTAHLTWQ